MALDYSPYKDLLNFLAQKDAGSGIFGNDWIDVRDYANAGSTKEVNPDWFTNPQGLFDTGGGNLNVPGSYNPYFSTEVRDYARKIATGLGLSPEDADTAALKYASSVLQAQGGQELYSEATSPYIVLDSIAAQLYQKAGKPYAPLTPDQRAYYANKSQDFQNQVKDARSDMQDADNLQQGMWMGSVLAGPALGAYFGAADAGAGLGNVAGSSAGAADAAAGLGGGTLTPPMWTDPVPPIGDTLPDLSLYGSPSWGGQSLPVSGFGAGADVAAGGGGLLSALGSGSAGAAGAGGAGAGGVGGGLGLGTGGSLLAGAGAASLLGGSGGDDLSGSNLDDGGGGLNALLGGAAGSALLGGGMNLGQLLAAGLGFAGSYNQTQALEDLANKYMNMGQPYRDKLQQLYTDQGVNDWLNSASVQTPVQMGTDALAKSLSVKGNPFGSGHALHELQNYATGQLYGQLGNERNRLANFGGLSAFNSAAPGAATGAINASGGMYDAAGYGLGALLGQNNTQNNVFKQLGLA